MLPSGKTPRRRLRGPGLALAAMALLGTGALALHSADGTAAPAAPPVNTGEPAISGTAEQGRRLSASTGTWTGSTPMSFSYRWVRCGTDGGLPDGSDCARISGATASRYELRRADVGFRLRVRVTATNADGSATAASNPTAVVVGPPVNTQSPRPTGTMVVGQRITADPGTWTGRQPISFSYRWLRCNTAGGSCVSISGGTSRSYRLTQDDAGHRMRFNVTGRNAVASTTVISTESPIVTEPLPSGAIRLPSGEISIPVSSVPRDQRLIVSEVRFSPSPVTSRTDPIGVSIRVKDTRGFVVRDAFVFVRATPRVTSGGDRQRTAQDGWVTYQLVPNANFPQPRPGFNVQFFVKAYRDGDPPLAGVAAYRLVQVRLAR